jgi:hypothetical protein
VKALHSPQRINLYINQSVTKILEIGKWLNDFLGILVLTAKDDEADNMTDDLNMILMT